VVEGPGRRILQSPTASIGYAEPPLALPPLSLPADRSPPVASQRAVLERPL